ncbi:MAG: hypothetical protein ABFC67_04820 [Mizugakiibacter sp.]|uniref:hypothetical protein n=1 Tax=Mizugakiibacter sp. TaxID=1972610 RepID=UPI00320FC7DE
MKTLAPLLLALAGCAAQPPKPAPTIVQLPAPHIGLQACEERALTMERERDEARASAERWKAYAIRLEKLLDLAPPR